MRQALINLWNFLTGFFSTSLFASVAPIPSVDVSQVWTSCATALVNIVGGVITAILLTIIKKKAENLIKKRKERKFIKRVNK